MTCLNDLNLGPSVRLFDTFRMSEISEYAGTYAGTVLPIWAEYKIKIYGEVTDDRLYFTGQQNPNIKT